MTSGLRWPWCGILSSRGSRGHMTCKSSFVFSWGYYTNVPTTHSLLWSYTKETDHALAHTHAQTSNCAHVQMQKQKPVAGETHDGLVNYWTELVLLICALVHRQRIPCLSNTSLHSYTWLQAASYAPLKYLQYMQKQQMQDGESFFFYVPAAQADGTLHGVPCFISWEA